MPARRRSSVSPSPRSSRSSASSVSRAKRSPWLSTADAVSAPTSSEKGRTAYPRASTSADDSAAARRRARADPPKSDAGWRGWRERGRGARTSRGCRASRARSRPCAPGSRTSFSACASSMRPLREPVAYLTAEPVTAVFFTFRDSPQRRRALAARAGSCRAVRALRPGSARRARASPSVTTWSGRALRRGGPALAGDAVKWGLERAGGYGGDFATVLASLRRANRADVVFSTVDTVGIPLMLLARAGRLRPPLVYVAIGLPERLAQLRSERMRRLYASALGSCASRDRVQPVRGGRASSAGSRARVRARESSSSPSASTPTSFTPVREPAGQSTSSRSAPTRIATSRSSCASRRACPTVSFRIVTSAEHRASPVGRRPRTSSSRPTSRSTRCGAGSREARVVALPVRENSYSGATTVLLQAMALGKPVVVTRTQAIATGYGLVDGENCRLVAPGDEAGFERALGGVLRRRVPRARARLERQSDGRAGAHVGAVRGSDRGAASRRSLSTAAISVGSSLKPTGSRCAASSAACTEPTRASRRRAR